MIKIISIVCVMQKCHRMQQCNLKSKFKNFYIVNPYHTPIVLVINLSGQGQYSADGLCKNIYRIWKHFRGMSLRTNEGSSSEQLLAHLLSDCVRSQLTIR